MIDRDTHATRPSIWAIVPIKGFDAVKKRLAGLLDAGERRALMLAMARDVLSALCESRRLAGVLIVSRAPQADALAASFGTERFAESAGADLPVALSEAAEYAALYHGAGGVFVAPADVPLIRAEEVDALLERHRRVTILPDGNRVGTNGLIVSPHDAIEFVFDGRSFEPHVANARLAGLDPAVVNESGFVLDIDTPGDLVELLHLGPNTETGIYLKRIGIPRRLSAPNSYIE